MFIPRPETEILVDEALEWLRSAGRGEGAKIFDAGTGSGAIAVALAANCAGAEVRAVDRSPDAVACAGENAKRNGVAKRVAVEEGDSIDILARAPGSYDLVVSNPPYVTTAEMKELPVEVREHDPEEALHGGPDGLDFYRAFVPVAARALDEGGALLMEVSDTVCPGVLHLLEKEERLGEARVRKDFSGHDRVVFAQAG